MNSSLIPLGLGLRPREGGLMAATDTMRETVLLFPNTTLAAEMKYRENK